MHICSVACAHNLNNLYIQANLCCAQAPWSRGRLRHPTWWPHCACWFVLRLLCAGFWWQPSFGCAVWTFRACVCVFVCVCVYLACVYLAYANLGMDGWMCCRSLLCMHSSCAHILYGMLYFAYTHVKIYCLIRLSLLFPFIFGTSPTKCNTAPQKACPHKFWAPVKG
jgi:hypothetical protein